MIKLISFSALLIYWFSMMILTYRTSFGDSRWKDIPRLVRWWIISKSPIGVPLFVIKERMLTKKVYNNVVKLTEQWKKAQEVIIDVDTLEGARALLNSPTSNGKTIKLTGVFDVNIPIFISVNLSVLDLSEAILVYKGCPVLDFVGTGNAVVGMTIRGADKDSPLYDNGDKCLIRTTSEAGNLLLGLNLDDSEACIEVPLSEEEIHEKALSDQA